MGKNHRPNHGVGLVGEYRSLWATTLWDFPFNNHSTLLGYKNF